ncbi:uncharacterized protein EI90DRAFT_3014892 [Cantharellus anzutake]|uniref:uncharacterized protein n=1 Tax=Cantharellus anzutake TaxID=1750568 RepID=UPI001908CE03|nr:uncharacterized protein EI90DRAFT_3014892 [Cantharellus anzutake]KAF8334620.1 hypothetical protein EI90DRAFT_3014892 [Cantharellus anzutake]
MKNHWYWHGKLSVGGVLGQVQLGFNFQSIALNQGEYRGSSHISHSNSNHAFSISGGGSIYSDFGSQGKPPPVEEGVKVTMAICGIESWHYCWRPPPLHQITSHAAIHVLQDQWHLPQLPRWNVHQVASAWMDEGWMVHHPICLESLFQHLFYLLGWCYTKLTMDLNPNTSNSIDDNDGLAQSTWILQSMQGDSIRATLNPIDHAIWPNGFMHRPHPLLQYKQPPSQPAVAFLPN